MPATPSSAPARPSSCSTPRWRRASTCAAAGPARARPRCSIRRRRWKASTPSCCRAARPSGSTPPPACRPVCASRAAASRCARRCVPIVPGAILFDLLSGGDKNWGRYPPYREFGYEAAKSAGADFALGSVGAGLGATTVNLKGGIGSASAQTRDGSDGRRARRGQCRRQRHHRRRSAFLGGAVRAGQRIRRPRLAAGFRRRRARLPQQGRARREHDAGGGRDRRQADQSAMQAARRDGADRPVARDLSGAHPARRRHRVRRGHGRQSRCPIRSMR